MLHVVTDFDGTLMHEDVGEYLIRALGLADAEEVVEAIRVITAGEEGSMGWLSRSYPLLADRRADVDEALTQVRPRDGAHAFLAFCRENGIPVTVLSDGAEYYIRRLLEMHQLAVDDVIVNPITYTEDGGFVVKPENPNPVCRWCGCCKSGTVRRLKEAGHQILYIGDGFSDFLGSGYADYIFARASLARHLEKAGESFFPYESFHDVLNVLSGNVERFADGSAEGRRRNDNTFCKFE